MDEPEGFLHLLEIFNRYPLHELIIHPRVLKDYYDNTPNWEMFGEAVHKSRNPVCYNGDIFTVEDYRRFRQAISGNRKNYAGPGAAAKPNVGRSVKRGGACMRSRQKQAEGFPR